MRNVKSYLVQFIDFLTSLRLGARAQRRAAVTLTASLLMPAFARSINAQESLSGGPRSCQEIQSDIEELETRLQRHAQALRSLGFEVSTREMENIRADALTDLEEFRTAAFEALLGGILNAASDRLLTGSLKIGEVRLPHGISSLNPAKRQQLLGLLRQHGLTDPFLWDAIRSVSNIQGKPQKLAKLARYLEPITDFTVKNALQGVVLVQGEPEDEVRKARQELLKEDIPEGALTAFELLAVAKNIPGINSFASYTKGLMEMLVPMADARVNARIAEAYTKLTENGLRSLQQIQALIKSDVAKLKAARTIVGPATCTDGELAFVVESSQSTAAAPKHSQGANSSARVPSPAFEAAVRNESRLLKAANSTPNVQLKYFLLNAAAAANKRNWSQSVDPTYYASIVRQVEPLRTQLASLEREEDAAIASGSIAALQQILAKEDAVIERLNALMSSASGTSSGPPQYVTVFGAANARSEGAQITFVNRSGFDILIIAGATSLRANNGSTVSTSVAAGRFIVSARSLVSSGSHIPVSVQSSLDLQADMRYSVAVVRVRAR